MLRGDYWMNIKHNYYIKKLSISEIARIYGIDRKTVRRYLPQIRILVNGLMYFKITL